MHRIRVRQAQAAVRADKETLVRRRDGDGGRLGPGPLPGFLHSERRPPAQDLRHEAPVAGIQVLDDENGDREVRRKRTQDRGDGRQPPGRPSQEDDVVPPVWDGRDVAPSCRIRSGHGGPLNHHGSFGRHIVGNHSLATTSWSHIVPEDGQGSALMGAGGVIAVKAGGPLKVMVVDDHLVFAEALALAIEATGQLTCVGTALNIDQASGLADEFEPDVAVVDVQLDGTDGVSGTRRLLDDHPQMQVLVLTGLPLSPSLVRDVADAGASGLLPKSASLSEVVETIPSLRGHAFAVDRLSLVSLCEATGGVDVPRRSRGSDLLTKREHDILPLLVSGVDLRSAAARLGITVNTARGYVKNLYRKLGVHNQLELLAVARERGLLENAG